MNREAAVSKEIVAYPKIPPYNGLHSESVRMALYSTPQYGKIDWNAASQSAKNSSSTGAQSWTYLQKYGVNYKCLKRPAGIGGGSVYDLRKGISPGNLYDGASSN